MASGRKQTVALYDDCPCTPCRTHDPPLRQQRRTIHRHRQREELNLRDKAPATARTGKVPLGRAPETSDDPGIPNAVKGFRVGRMGYVVGGEAGEGPRGLGGPLPLTQAPKKPDNPGIPDAAKSFRVGRMGYVIGGDAPRGLGGPYPPRQAPKKPDNPGIPDAVKTIRVGRMGYEIVVPTHKIAATKSIYAPSQGSDAGSAAPRALPASMPSHTHHHYHHHHYHHYHHYEASVSHEDVEPALDDGSLDSLSRSGLPFAPASATHSDYNPSGLFDAPVHASAHPADAELLEAL